MTDNIIKKILLADDHPMVLQGITACLNEDDELEVVGVASDGERLLKLYDEVQCDIVIVDINLPGYNGIETTKLLVESDQSAKVLIFSMHQDVEYVRQAIDAGALGYVLKDSTPGELISAIKTIFQGGTYFSQSLVSSIISKRAPVLDFKLTQREMAILHCLVDGKPSKVIAYEQGVSVRTIESHRRNLKSKLGGKSSNECIAIAYRAGLISK